MDLRLDAPCSELVAKRVCARLTSVSKDSLTLLPSRWWNRESLARARCSSRLAAAQNGWCLAEPPARNSSLDGSEARAFSGRAAVCRGGPRRGLRDEAVRLGGNPAL